MLYYSMSESKIIELLSIESERMLEESSSMYPMFDTEISAWKENVTTFSSQRVQEPVRVRIRTVESRQTLTRNSSSMFYLGTFSSSNPSRSSSPGPEHEKRHHAKKNSIGDINKKIVSFTLCQNPPEFLTTNNNTIPISSIRIHKLTKMKRKRKPIKVFRLPQVGQGEEEE